LRPTHFMGCHNSMTVQDATQWCWRPVIEKNSHAEACRNFLRLFNCQALLGMPQYHFDLLARDPREPFKKIIDPGAAFEVFE